MPEFFSRTRGCSEIVGSAICFGLMAYFTKHLSTRIHGAQIALMRGVVGLCSVLLWSAVRKVRLRPQRWDLLLLRGFLGGVAILIYFVSLKYLPVGTGTLLVFTSPIFTTLFSWIFLRERLGANTAIAFLIAAVGVTLVVVGQGELLGGTYRWQLMCVVGAMLAGGAVTSIRAARQTDGTAEIFAVFSLMLIVCTSPFSVVFWKMPTVCEWGLLLFIGTLSLLGQIALTHALRVIEAAMSGLISQLTVVITLAMGHFIDHDPFPPLAVLGSVLTFVGVIWASHIAAHRDNPHTVSQ